MILTATGRAARTGDTRRETVGHCDASGPQTQRPLPLDALVVCAFAWIGAHLLVSSPYGPNPYRDLVRPEVWPNVPAWLMLPAPGTSLVEDPVNRLLAALATGASLLYAAGAMLLAPGRLRRSVKACCLGLAVFALVLVPACLEMALSVWHGKPWHGHDGGVLQTDQATDLLLQGTDPYSVDYLDTPQAEQSARSAFWKRLGGNPALYHLPYPPGCFVLPVPLRPAARAVFGFYDPRMLYLLGYAAALGCAWALRGPNRAATLAAVALCPMLVPYLVEGRNEALALGPMLGMALALQRGRRGVALFLWGLACTLKQFAWLYAPFVVCWLLGPWPASRPELWRRARPLAWAALPVAALIGPFLLWDARGFWADNVAFMSGASDHPYPFGGTPGLGLANLLLYFGRVASLQEPYDFGAWQIALSGPLALALCWRLLRRPDWRLVIAGGTLFASIFVFASRVLHVNYLGLLFPLLVAGAASEAGAEEAA
jgi:hypothetical protein